MTKDEALKMALEALENHTVQTRPIAATEAAITATKAALVQPSDSVEQEPVGWLYPEGLKALEAGKCWTLYGTKQDCDNSTPVYLHPQSSSKEPYAWVTFTPYGEEDDVWYENPEGHLIEGWTYKPLYDTAPPKREWVGLTDDEINKVEREVILSMDRGKFERDGRVHDRLMYRAIEAKLKELNHD